MFYIALCTLLLVFKERSSSCIERTCSNLHHGRLHSHTSLEVRPLTLPCLNNNNYINNNNDNK